ncbi:MAG TPA: hypothetical protein VMT52_01515, partial [Planctomycetota bacterium]|nr:hypothetical protein [Planctomycetota bacterium]
SNSQQRWLQTIFPPAGTTQTRFLIQQPNLAPGYYWAAVEKSASVGNVPYSFQFCAGLPPGCRDSNTPSSPRYLGVLPALGSLPAVNDCINRNSDVVDAFTFTVPPVSQPRLVQITLSPRTGNADMSLWSPFNTVLARSTRTGTQTDVIQIPLYQGTYTIWVVPGTGPDGDINYNLTVGSICLDVGAASPAAAFQRLPTRICNLSGCTQSYRAYSECIGGTDAADWFLVSEAGRPFQQQMWLHVELAAGGSATLAIWQGNRVFPANIRTVGSTVILDATILPFTSYKIGVINLNGAPNRTYTLDMTVNQ